MIGLAIRNLLSRPVRSLLALMGLTVAIMGMVGLFSVAAGLNALLLKTFGRIPGIVAMQPGAPIPILSRLPVAWADEIARQPGVRTVCREVWGQAHLVEGQIPFNPPRLILGADPVAFLNLQTAVYRDDMVAGRFLNPDRDRDQLHCLISRQIAADYGKQVGETLRVDGHSLTIIGIYDTGSILLDMTIILDGQAARRMLQFEPTLLSSVYIEPDGTVPLEVLQVQLRALFRGRKPPDKPTVATAGTELLANLALSLMTNQRVASDHADAASPAIEDNPSDPVAEERIEIQSALQWGRRLGEFSSDLDVFLYLMSGIGVVVALLSILNTMLMSVSERMIEFGVLRANGWSSRDVMRLILAESAVLGVCGGVLGCLVGWAATVFMNGLFPDKLALYASPTVLTGSLLFAAVLGTFGGVYPAWLAVRMSPMDAIRRG